MRKNLEFCCYSFLEMTQKLSSIEKNCSNKNKIKNIVDKYQNINKIKLDVFFWYFT